MTTRRTSPRPARRSSRGTALPIALLVLVVLTLLGTAAVFTAGTEADIAGNSRQDLRTLSLAEAGIHEALARVNMRDPSAPTNYQIVPAESPAGVPVSGWTASISEGTSVGGLPVVTTIAYKIEDPDELPVPRCDGDGCDGDVVRFHTSFGYAGAAVPSGSPAAAPAVLQIASTATDSGGTKTVRLDAVRSITQVKTPAAVRACGDVSVTGSTNINGTGADGNTAISAGGTVTSSGGGSTVTGSIEENDPCPTAGSNPSLFEQTFGVTPAELRAMAHITLNGNEGQPNSTNGQIIYVTNNPASQASWQGNKQYGTASEPVIVVFDGDFNIQGGVKIYGIVYVRGSFTIGAGTPVIQGAVVVEGGASLTMTGNSTFAYDGTSLDNLNRSSPFTTISWGVN